MADGEQDAGDRHGCRGQQLGGPAAAELAGDQAGDGDHGRRCERGGQPETHQRAGEQRVHGGGQQRRERRLVGVPERRLPAGAQEVQLVAVISVAAGEGQEEQGSSRRQRAQRLPRHGWTDVLAPAVQKAAVQKAAVHKGTGHAPDANGVRGDRTLPGSSSPAGAAAADVGAER